MERLKVGVLGAGTMGVNHLRVYAEEASRFELVGLYDADPRRAAAAAARFHCGAFPTAETLLENVEAVSVVVPSSLHRNVGLLAAERGVHALIEKPLALNTRDATELAQAYAERKLLLQVGHIERFNPVVTELKKLVDPEQVIFIEAHRYGPFSGNGRITDASVVEDLLIHDVDLAAYLMEPLPVSGLAADGEILYSGNVDFCSAMLKFDGKAHAVISASRVSQEKERTITVHMRESCVSADLLLKTLTVSQHTDSDDGDPGDGGYRQDGVIRRIFVPMQEPLRQELLAFYDAVTGQALCAVPGETGTEAVRLCERILNQVKNKGSTSE